ncbi:MAG: hypothetical protein IPL98_17645 [Saprospiraceae bacterium]|nr:hypothetical protein [Saprospiraceae bacterium]
MKSTCIIKLGAIGLLAYYFLKNKSSYTSSPSSPSNLTNESVSTDMSCSDGTCKLDNVGAIYTRNKVRVPYTV